jgi:hypothetical protein
LIILLAGAAPACAQSIVRGRATVSPLASFAVSGMTGVDGSRISLQPFARGLLREITTAEGRTIKTAFTLLNDRMGVVSGEGGGNIIGMFSLSGASITTLYSDGGSETLLRDGADSVLVVAQAVEGSTACTAWYPAGHVFSMAERKAALARQARRLGLKLTRAQVKDADCSAESEKAERAQQAVIAMAPRQPAAVPAVPQRAPGYPEPPADFDDFYHAFVAPQEGGYVANDGNGSPANYGINQGANPDVEVAALRQDDAKQILYERYWLRSGADQLPQALAMVHGDTAINMGVKAANELLAQAGDDPHLYLELRTQRYHAIAAANPGKAEYLPVWLARVESLRAMIGGEAAPREAPRYAEYPANRGRTTWVRGGYWDSWGE